MTLTAGGVVSLTGTVNPECAPDSTYAWSLSLGGDLPAEDVVITPASGTTITNYSASFVVPADTPAGTYTVSVVGVMTDGPGCMVLDDPNSSPEDPARLRPSISITVLVPQGDCPSEASGFVLTQAAHPADANGDGFVCVKQVNGKGNQGDGSNVKDNNAGA